MVMRVVAGSAKGRPLRAPRGGDTRPTSDFAREGIFNVLKAIVDIEGAHVVDLFAGSGALGIEALSRGAASVTFVDIARSAVDAIRRNLADTGFEGDVRKGDVLRVVDQLPPADLVFADPPYSFDAWAQLLASLVLEDDAVVIAESDRDVAPPPGFGVARTKRWGGTVVTFLVRQEAA